MKNTDEGAWLTPEQVATRLQLHRNSVYDAVRQGRIRSARIGRRIRIRENWVDDLLQVADAS